MEIEIAAASRKRRRPPKACEQCRLRKVRCDQLSPCSQCIRLKIAKCTYDPETLTKRNEAKATPGTKPPPRIAPPTPASSIELDNASRLSFPASLIHSPKDNTAKHVSASKDNYRSSPDMLEDRLLHTSYAATRPANVPLVESSHSLHGAVTKTRLLGRSHWINIVHEFSFIFELQRRLELGRNGDVKQLLDKCKILGRTIKNHIYSSLKTYPTLREHVPTKDVADRLIENYFRAFETYYRILHIPSFRHLYAQFWEAPDNATQAFTIQLLLVLAIGTCVSEADSKSLHTSALEWIHTSQSWLSSPFMEKSRLTVSGVQAQCLLLLAREVNSVGPDLIWISAGSLMRSAVLIGLHRDPVHFPRLSPFQSELRRRLWATVMEICLQSAMTAGGAPMISSDSHDCQPPSNLNDDGLDQDRRSLSVPEELDVLTQSSIQIALVSTFDLRSRVAQILNDFRVEQTFTETLELGSKLTEALQMLSTRLYKGIARDATIYKHTAMMMYEMMTYRFLMSLHQLFAFKAFKDPIYYFSRKVCLDTALLLASKVFPPPKSTAAEDPDFDKILDRCCGSPKSIIGVAFLIIMLELTAQLQNPKTSLSTIQDGLLRQEMFRGLEEYADWSLRRMHWGETNPKGYLFSMCGVAHLRALEAGDLPETAAFEVGTRTAHVCIDVLQKHLDSFTKPAVPDIVGEDLGEEFGMPFGESFGWDDWDPGFNIGPPNIFFPQNIN